MVAMAEERIIQPLKKVFRPKLRAIRKSRRTYLETEMRLVPCLLVVLPATFGCIYINPAQKTACAQQSDCVDGYTCLNAQCVARASLRVPTIAFSKSAAQSPISKAPTTSTPTTCPKPSAIDR